MNKQSKREVQFSTGFFEDAHGQYVLNSIVYIFRPHRGYKMYKLNQYRAKMLLQLEREHKIRIIH
jgi:hypothetical protein